MLKRFEESHDLGDIVDDRYTVADKIEMLLFRFAPGQAFVMGSDFSRYCLDAVDWLLAEKRCRMLSIGLHLRIIGRPGRIGALDAILARVARDPRIWVARRRDIAAHVLAG